MMKIVYVTGCLGFIGSYVTKFCLKEGWYVRGIDKITYASNTELLKEFSKSHNFVFENKDINDLEWLYDCDYIINTAAETHVDNSIVKSDDFVHSNVNGVHHFISVQMRFTEILLMVHIKKLIYLDRVILIPLQKQQPIS